MYAIATCVVTIMRGTTVDALGDPQDNGTVIASGLIACLNEDSGTVWDPATQTPRVVRKWVGSMQSDAPVQSGDQLRDDTHGISYAVIEVTQPGGPAWVSDLTLDLRRVTPAA